jgi:predicted N-acyltransferase
MSRELRYVVTAANGVTSVDEADWNALVGDDDPFVEHGFLSWMEEAGCVGGEAGWLPHPVLVWEEEGDTRRLVGAAPTYLKDNSYGEYIFDWGWADASIRGGIQYYPKVVAAVPFTPATGPRLLVHPDADRETVVEALASGARGLADAVDASSVHWLFTSAEQRDALVGQGYLARRSYQFHWHNEGYGSWDDFLGDLRSKRRKEIRREQREALASGLTLAVEPLDALSTDDRVQLYRCYRDTIDSHHQIPYLTETWWMGLSSTLGHRGLVATARDDGKLVAGALAFHKGKHLYGRYWGSLVPMRAVHFDLCYHRLVGWAIDHGIERVEAGAQGAHKLPRGFLATETCSAHWLRHPGLSDAVARFLVNEGRSVRATLEHYGERTPFKREHRG